MTQRKKAYFSAFLLFFLSLSFSGCVENMNLNLPIDKSQSDYENALNLYLRGNLNESLTYAKLVKKTNPQYSKSKTLIRKVNSLKINIAEGYKDLGRIYENAGIINKAKEEYQNALSFAPNSKRIKAMLNRLDLKAKESIVKINKPVVKKVNVEDDYLNGLKNYKEGKYSASIVSLNKVLRINPSYKNTNEIIVEAKKKRASFIDQHLKKGIHYYKQESLESAVKEWNLVLNEDPTNEKALGYKKKAEGIMKKLKQIKSK